MTSKTIIIIGGSFSGIGVAKALLKDLTGVKVILINPSDVFFFNIAAPRILTKPKALSSDKYLYSIATVFKSASKDTFKFIQDAVRQIDTLAKTVTVSNDTIPYDYLVIASGSSSKAAQGDGVFAPFKPTGVDSKIFQSQIQTAQETIASAQSIIIGGAGPLGVEIAGELADTSTDKKITIITSGSRVLPMLRQGPSSTAEKLLAKKNVNIVKGASVVEASQKGVSPNNSFIPTEYLVDGWVHVDSYFRVCVPGNDAHRPEGVYAVGDITIHTPRTAIKSQEQVPVVAANIKAAINGSSNLKAYTAASSSIMMIVPVGQNAGTGQMFGWTVWGKMVSMVKGKDFLTSRAPGMIGIA